MLNIGFYLKNISPLVAAISGFFAVIFIIECMGNALLLVELYLPRR